MATPATDTDRIKFIEFMLDGLLDPLPPKVVALVHMSLFSKAAQRKP